MPDQEIRERLNRRYEKGERVLWAPARKGVIAEGFVCEPDTGKHVKVQVTKVLSSKRRHSHLNLGQYTIERRSLIAAPAEVVDSEAMDVPEVVED